MARQEQGPVFSGQRNGFMDILEETDHAVFIGRAHPHHGRIGLNDHRTVQPGQTQAALIGHIIPVSQHVP